MNKKKERGKWLFDKVVAGIILVLLFPLFLIIALLVFVLDGGNPFFVQERMGKNGKKFQLIKFKTMKPDPVSEKNSFQAGQTRRITPLGKWLRKTKLDELPQLINVLKGEMSLVGPRPEVEQWTQVYPEKWEIVHQVKPGITDNASIVFKNEENILARADDPEDVYFHEILPRKLEMYIEYVNNRTFGGDLKIIVKTIKSVWLN